MSSPCPREDLTLHVYGFLEGEECDRVEAHLRDCAHCRAAAEEMLVERDLVALELSLETDREAVAPPLAPRRRLPIAALAAAAVVVVLALGAWILVRPGRPEEAGWRDLPDGSRYRVLETAEVRSTSLRRLDLEEGSVLVEVREDEEEFEVLTPFGSVRSPDGRFAVSVESGATLVEVLDGSVRLQPVEGGVEAVVPGSEGRVQLLVVEVVRDPELLVRIRELEERLRALGEMLDDETLDPPPGPGQAVERHDWAGLAESLLETAEEVRQGRLPNRAAVVRRWLRQLEELERLAEATGIEPTLEALARDPRTGPRLLAATLQKLWPETPPADLDRVKEKATRVLEEFSAKAGVAETAPQKEAAEAELRDALKEIVEEFEEVHGPSEEAEAPPTTKETVDVVLRASGFERSSPRVYDGTASEIESRIVRGWSGDRGYGADDADALVGLARAWLRSVADVESRAPADVVAALHANLRGRRSPAAVDAVLVSRLRSELMRAQADAEARLPAAPSADVSVPTYLLIDR